MYYLLYLIILSIMEILMFVLIMILIYLIYYLIYTIKSLNDELKEIKYKCISATKLSKEDFKIDTPDPVLKLSNNLKKNIEYIKNFF